MPFVRAFASDRRTSVLQLKPLGPTHHRALLEEGNAGVARFFAPTPGRTWAAVLAYMLGDPKFLYE